MSIAIYAIPLTGASPQSGAIGTAYPQQAQVVPFGSIGSTYPAAPAITGSATNSVSFAYVALTNTTSVNLFVCFAGIGATPDDQFFILAGQTKSLNFLANLRVQPIDLVYVRSDGAAPTSGQLIFEGYI
jgi:hypothetical protein